VLLFTFKMLAEGDVALPASGIGEIAAQLASRLRAPVCTGAEVEAITAGPARAGEGEARATGVTLAGGEWLAADHVVLAGDAPASARLARAVGVRPEVPTGALPCTTLYLAAAVPPLPGRALWLNAAADPVVSHAVTLTEVAPSYGVSADPGAPHLLAASAVGEQASLDDDALVRGALADLRAMHRAASATDAQRPFPETRVVAIERVPYAQFPQPPHFRELRPPIATSLRSLWLAGEALHSSSLEGAARGGRAAAQAIVAACATRA
jgi:protoporphyrinogen oxidase